MISELTLRRIERCITAIALLAVGALAFAAVQASKAYSAEMGDTGGCPKGKTLFSIMDSDGTYKPICLPINGGA
jgi:hypothetical protein